MAYTVFAAVCAVQTTELRATAGGGLEGGVVAGEPVCGLGDNLGLAAPVAGLFVCGGEGDDKEETDEAVMVERHLDVDWDGRPVYTHAFPREAEEEKARR